MKPLILLIIVLSVSCKESNKESVNNKDENLAWYQKAEEELNNRNFTVAIKYANKVINSSDIKFSYTATMSYMLRGTAKAELMDYRGAISDFTYVIDNSNISNPKPMAYELRGLCKFELNDIDGACIDWSKSGELENEKAYKLIREYCN